MFSARGRALHKYGCLTGLHDPKGLFPRNQARKNLQKQCSADYEWSMSKRIYFLKAQYNSSGSDQYIGYGVPKIYFKDQILDWCEAPAWEWLFSVFLRNLEFSLASFARDKICVGGLSEIKAINSPPWEKSFIRINHITLHAVRPDRQVGQGWHTGCPKNNIVCSSFSVNLLLSLGGLFCKAYTDICIVR